MLAHVKRLLLRTFGSLPVGVRRALVRTGVATYTVGCVVVVARGDEVLLLEQPHRQGLTLPGGLLSRHESPGDCVRREVREELGVELDVPDQPVAVLVDGAARRVDLVFAIDDPGLDYASSSAEVRRLRWLLPSASDPGSATARAILAARDARATRDTRAARDTPATGDAAPGGGQR